MPCLPRPARTGDVTDSDGGRGTESVTRENPCERGCVMTNRLAIVFGVAVALGPLAARAAAQPRIIEIPRQPPPMVRPMPPGPMTRPVPPENPPKGDFYLY